jgi:ABC-type oligopeptide transport system ATPase subunit
MEVKEYPLHDEEHEIISTPIIPGKKRMTPEEYEDKITELLTKMKVLQETVDRQNREISEMKGRLCL